MGKSITRRELAKIIAKRIGSAVEYEQNYDRVRKRIEYAAQRGDLTGDGTSPTTYDWDAAIAWARTKYPGLGFDRLAITHQAAAHIVVHDRVKGEAKARHQPATLAECMEELHRALERVEELEKEAEALRQDAQRWRDFVRRSGRRGRL